MDPKKYKAYHEEVMSNNTGSTPGHAMLFVLLTVVSTAMVVIGRQRRSQRLQLVIEYVGLILPPIFAYTVLSGYVAELTKFIIALVYIQSAYYLNRVSMFRTFGQLNTFNYQRLECITNIRGLVYILTIICILAVDFSCFPRTLSKTERYGYSLMDTGVGLFTLGSGLVHKRYADPRVSVLLKDNYRLLMVPALGLSRTFLVKSLDYQEHVSEYGVHWNFFYTLAVAKFLSTCLLHFTPPKMELQLCSFVFVAHHCLLGSGGLEKWVFSDIARDTFLNANREGIASCLGYTALYLFGSYIKGVLTNHTVLRGAVLCQLATIWVVVSVIVFRTSLFSPVSRTLANGGYCIFVIGVFMLSIILLYILEVVLQEHQVSSVPLLFEAFNRNGLFLFVLGNVLTGLINMSIQTLLVKPWVAISIINTYLMFIVCVAVFLQKRGITLL